MKKSLIGTLLLSLALPLAAQVPDSLVVLLEKHPALRAFHAQKEGLEHRAEAATAWPEPMVSSSWFALPVETRLGPQQWRIGASQDIPWKGALANRRELADNKAQLPQMALEETRAALLAQLREAWLELTALREKQQLLRREAQWLDLRITLTRSRVANGLARLDAALLLEIEREEVNRRLGEMASAELEPTARINGLLSRETSKHIRTDSTLTDQPWPARAPWQPEKHPAAARYELEKTGAQLRIEANRWARTPAVNVGIDYILVGRRDVPELTDNGRDIIAPRIGIMLPLARRKYRADDQAERAAVMQADARKADIVNRLHTAIAGAKSRYDQADIALQSITRQISIAEDALPLLLSAWAENKASMEELLQLHRKIWQMRQALVDQKLKKARAAVNAREIMTKIEE